jgi:drug/metabolite transporter (DMT)-like permease
VTGATIFIFALSLISLGPLMAIDNTAPFWAILMGYCFLGEKLTLLEVIAIICSFGGILLISFGKHNSEEDLEDSKTNT